MNLPDSEGNNVDFNLSPNQKELSESQETFVEMEHRNIKKELKIKLILFL